MESKEELASKSVTIFSHNGVTNTVSGYLCFCQIGLSMTVNMDTHTVKHDGAGLQQWRFPLQKSTTWNTASCLKAVLD